MRRRLSGLLVATMAFALIVGASTKAEAAFFAAICNDITCTGGGDLIVQDNAAGDSANLVNGFISMSFTTGNYTVVVNLSQSKPLIGSAGAPQLDLNFTATGTTCTVAAPCDVWLFASDNGFTGVGAPTMTIAGNQPAGGFVNARAWGGGTNNTITGAGTGGGAFTNLLINTTMTNNTQGQANFSFAGSGPGVGVVSNPYSLTLGVNIHSTIAGTTTGDQHLSVPEPATMALFGLGLVGFGAAGRRRQKK